MTTCRRFYRESGDFALCVNIGKKDYVLAENPIDSNTIFYYGVKGIGKLGTMFSDDYIIVKEGQLVDVRSYLHKFRIFHSLEDFHLVGFNTLEKGQSWEGRLINDDEKILDLNVMRDLYRHIFIVCFNGKPKVNDKTMKRYEYAKIDLNKQYNINLDGGVLGMFYRD